MSVQTPSDLVHVQESLLQGVILKVHHSNLVGSERGVGRVSVALNFLLNLPALEYFYDLSNPMMGVTRQVLFLVVGFSIGLLCVRNMLLSLLYKEGVILLCSKRRERSNS